MTNATRDLLEQHFDTAFAAPDGIAKLRELILTLAMQGKLVEQDPADQPASELLKDINAEKQRLVKAGKIKAPKPLPPIKPEEVPYQLPQGWEWVRVREICHDWGQKIPDSTFTYIDVGAIDNTSGKIGSNLQILGASDAPSRARKIVKTGTVIYSTVRPYLLNIAIIDKEYDPEPIASTAFAILHPFRSLSARFIYHYLRSPAFIRYVEATQKGVAYPAINDGDFFSGLFPLPPFPEQNRIVALIDQLMACCDALEALRKEREEKRLAVHTAAMQQLLAAPDSSAWGFIEQHFGELYSVKENVAELRKAILQLAVMGKLVPQDPNDQPASELLKEIETEKKRLVKEGKIKAPKSLPPVTDKEESYALPKGWEWVRLEELGTTQTGTTPPSKDQGNFGDHIPFIGPGDIKNGVIDYSGKGLSESGLSYSRLIEKGSVLMVCIGGSIGKHAINIQNLACNQQINTITPFHPIPVKFLYWLMATNLFQRIVLDSAGGSATPIINKQKWSSIAIPVPPLSEQHRIVAKIDLLMGLCNKLDQQIAASTCKQNELLTAVMAKV
ncbi:restriction endonuclease subunit S [Thalassospira sp. B30-1]|jgi:type I restriction enzyme, S subunit|uniref:restriction endonuclease subunit S n=1 Tax=Thalassospira sp. B30-1 TaxID=2785911 RepID=UPI0018CA40A3|nr:restriction endonuclease subunit S [Thalassospira sp. B30-1]QPL36727.1 restriction endonuclease subunit S [Thalassospira sp. B30-1]